MGQAVEAAGRAVVDVVVPVVPVVDVVVPVDPAVAVVAVVVPAAVPAVALAAAAVVVEVDRVVPDFLHRFQSNQATETGRSIGVPGFSLARCAVSPYALESHQWSACP